MKGVEKSDYNLQFEIYSQCHLQHHEATKYFKEL